MTTKTFPIIVAHLTPAQRSNLRRHWRCKFYDRNGTGEPVRIIKRVFVPSDKEGNPLLVLLCTVSGKDSQGCFRRRKDKRGRFDFCVFTDVLAGQGHVPSDSYGYGTEKQGLDSLKEKVFGSITGIWPWVIDEAWTKTHQILEAGK